MTFHVFESGTLLRSCKTLEAAKTYVEFLLSLDEEVEYEIVEYHEEPEWLSEC